MKIPARFNKADMPACVAMYGTFNSKQFKDAPKGCLQYISFVGAMDPETRHMVGEHVFKELASPANGKFNDFNQLPGLEEL